MSVEDRIAVCSWSLQASSSGELVEKVRATGVSRVQLALEPLIEGGAWADCAERLAGAGIGIVSGMMGCVGEDYATIARIAETGGVMPDATWPATLANMKKAVPLAKKLGLKLVTFHAGFIPHHEGPELSKGLARVGEVAKVFAAEGIEVALETGQEPAEALVGFLETLGRKGVGGVGVNFDPANMLLYGSGDPTAALKQLLPWVKQVHIKDAVPSGKAGEWGSEVPSGTGKVDWAAFFGTLRAANYAGNYVIEREAGTQRVEDVRTAKALVLGSA